MISILRLIVQKLRHWASSEDKASVASTQEHWINHIYDETVSWPNGALMWANVHGFDEGPGAIYWLGIDIRSFGIRCADYVLKFKSKSLYEEYKSIACNDTKNLLSKMRNDSRLSYTNGGDMDVEYRFRWGGSEKSFHVHLGTDSYAEQR